MEELAIKFLVPAIAIWLAVQLGRTYERGRLEARFAERALKHFHFLKQKDEDDSLSAWSQGEGVGYAKGYRAGYDAGCYDSDPDPLGLRET